MIWFLLVEGGLLIAGWAMGWSHVLRMTAVMMPYMVLICVTAFLGGTLNVLNRFAAPALAPMILNVVIIATAWVAGRVTELDESVHLTLIAYSVVFAGALQLASQWIWLRAIGYRVAFNFDWSAPRVRKVMRLMVPLVFGASAIQFNTFADSLIAQFMVPDGRGLSVLGYAQYINHLPLGIFSTALATAIFPMLSRRAAAGDRTGFAEVAQTGVRTTLFIALPAGVGLILIASPLIRVLYEHGEFGPADTARVSRALSLYCLGMWAYSLQQILVRAFFAMEDNRTPVRISMAMLGLNFVLNICLVLTPLREAGVALATAITGAIQAVLLAVALRKKVAHMHWRGVAGTTIKACVATAIMALAVWTLRGDSPWGTILPGGDVLRLAALVVAGGTTYVLAARLLGMKELGLILGSHEK